MVGLGVSRNIANPNGTPSLDEGLKFRFQIFLTRCFQLRGGSYNIGKFSGWWFQIFFIFIPT